eukprot:XP_014783159.1 PREDICTED: carboxypeptidase B-like isoform X3 [Octopus bimaculoides]
MSALLSFVITMAVAVVVFLVVVVIDMVGVTGTPLKVPGSNTTQGYSTLISKEEVLRAETGHNGIDIDHYLALQEYSGFMKEINSSYPNAEVMIYGKSYEGRDLMAVKFYRNSCNPTIFVEAGIHAREWIASAVTFKIINTIARNSSQDEEMSKLLDLYNWVFVPLVNPDGYDFSRHENRYWRKNKRVVTKNCTGVDLNRNFDINWGTDEASGCSTDWVKKVLGVKYSYAIEMRPTDNDTRGFSLPASEIEPTSRDIFVALKTFANGFKRNISYLRDSLKNCNNTEEAQKETGRG